MKKFSFLTNVSLKDYCTMRVGGNAKYLYIAYTNKSLLKVCKFCITHNIKYKIIGLGANLLFLDEGFDGMIIVNKSKKFYINNQSIIVDAGVNLNRLIGLCCERGFGGIEGLFGIPASIGGAIFNNVSSKNYELSKYVDYVEVCDPNSLHQIIKLTKNECQFSYRDSLFKSKNYIILRVKFTFDQSNSTKIKNIMLESLTQKKSTQPLDYPSCGSIFKRASNIIPSKTIDELGLKGTRIGDAEISTKHAGFIINKDSACAKDILKLIQFIKSAVYDKTGQILEEEIEVVK